MATDCGYLLEALKDRSLNDYLLALYQKRRECRVFVWFQIIDIWVPHTTYIWKEKSHSNKGSKLTINQTIIDPLYSLIEISSSFSGKKIRLQVYSFTDINCFPVTGTHCQRTPFDGQLELS